VNEATSTVLDRRDSSQLLEEVLRRRPGYLPEWAVPPGSADYALAGIWARYAEGLVQRLNQAPAKHKLAFFDVLGLSLIPAQSARAPIVFQLDNKSVGGSAPAGTQVSALPPPGSSQPIIFETETAVGVRGGSIAQIFSLWPGRDEFIDHSADFKTGLPVRAFSRMLLQPTPHELYLSHEKLLALAGNVEIGVAFDIATPSSQSMELIWEYWDGQVWRGFLSINPNCGVDDPFRADGTLGLTRSGTFVLQTDCAQAVKTKINGADGFWLKARLTQPLPANPDQDLPDVEAIKISSTVNRTLRGILQVADPAPPRNIGVVVLAQQPPSSLALSIALALPAAPPTITLSGTVFNAALQPVQGAVVTLSVDGATVNSVATAADGAYSLPPQTLTPDNVIGFEVTWAGIVFGGPDGFVPPPSRPFGDKHIIDLTISLDGLQPDKAFADAITLDVSKPFYPMGQQPQPGSTFYMTSKEIFSKPGATVRVYFARTRSPQDESSITNETSEQVLPHTVNWEYWNGRTWAPLPMTSALAFPQVDLNHTEIAEFKVPIDLVPVNVNGEEGLWVRLRLQSGMYGFRKQVSFATDAGTNKFSYVIAQPPVLADIRFGYTWQYGPFSPEQVLTYSDFRYEDHTYESTWPGTLFKPFQRLSDLLPALYLGFEKKPPAAELGLYFDVVEDPADPQGPALAWEYWDGLSWSLLPSEEATAQLRRPGIVNVLAEPDDEALNRFGTPLHWIRARLKEDGPPGEPTFNGIYQNCVWASERQTLHDVPVSTSNGTPNQVFTLPQTPILAGEQLEVLELTGARANVEWPIVARELFPDNASITRDLEDLLQRQPLFNDLVWGPLRLKRDRKAHVTEVWVTWEYHQQLFSSGPNDRHYAIDRALGKVRFGDGVNGRIPPVSATVVMRQMTTGGGLRGNVAAGAIGQLLGVVPGIQAVFNPRPGEGGANMEGLPALLERAPKTIRHRGRAISLADYETLAHEASPAVAFARAIPCLASNGRRLPGWVTVVIVPFGDDARPFPSFGLREDVRASIEARACADLAADHRITIAGPNYEPLDLTLTVTPISASQAGAMESSVRSAVGEFLHPIRGGPDGRGWDLGRDVFLSDVAAVVEAVPGVDYVEEIELLRENVPQGESFAVASGSIVVAGTITIKLKLPEK
jgi:hypothetical protein